jgi:fatty-acyl-CoA synthase
MLTPPMPRWPAAGFIPGDGAVVHPDGFVEIRDRLKDVIISGGENISSIEVEGVLLQHPADAEAAGTAVTADELREFSRSRLVHFKAPRAFSFLSELPKTATGKTQKFALRRR